MIIHNNIIVSDYHLERVLVRPDDLLIIKNASPIEQIDKPWNSFAKHELLGNGSNGTVYRVVYRDHS